MESYLDPVYDLCYEGNLDLGTRQLVYTFSSNKSVEFANFIPPSRLNDLKRALVYHNPRIEDRLKYNPFEKLTVETNLTTMELASIIYAINPISCRKPDSYIRGSPDSDMLRYVYVDLDTTPGMSITMQILYPQSYCYGMSQQCNKKETDFSQSQTQESITCYSLSKDWNFVNNRLDISNFDIQSTQLEGLRQRCLYNNPRGIDVALITTTDFDRWEKLFTGISVLFETGSLVYRFRNRYDLETSRLIYLTSQCFESIELYKPACSPCDNDTIYLIGHSRRTDSNAMSKLTKIQKKEFDDLNVSFVKWMSETNNYLIDKQIEAIEGIDQRINRELEFNLDRCLGMWKIPVTYRL